MELVSTMEISGEEREIADAYAREQCAANAEAIDGINSNLDEQIKNGYLGKNLVDIKDVTLSSSGYVFNNQCNIESGTYTFSFDFSGDRCQCQIALRDASGENIISPILQVSSGRNSITVTINQKAYSFGFYGATGSYYNMQLEIGNTATDYVPFVYSNTKISELNESLSDMQTKKSYSFTFDGSYQNTVNMPLKKGVKYKISTQNSVTNDINFFYNSTQTPENIIFAFKKGESEKYFTPSKDCAMPYVVNYSENGTYTFELVCAKVDELKNDLSAYADGTKAVAKATTADSATKATQDGNGNDISNTYLRKTDSTNVLLPIGSMIMCNAEEISQYYGTWADLGTTTITCTTGAGEDIMDVTYTTHVFNRTG